MFSFDNSSLVGKPFDLGKVDCFDLVREFYKLNFDIDIPNFARPNDWEPEEENLIDQLYDKAGFVKMDKEDTWPPCPADILVCTVGGSVPNHLVIFLGGNNILHHKVGMLSAEEIMRPAWKRYTSYILRHPQVPDLTVERPTMDLLEVYRDKLI